MFLEQPASSVAMKLVAARPLAIARASDSSLDHGRLHGISASPRFSGRPMWWWRRILRGLLELLARAAEPALALAVRHERRAERLGIEIGPQHVGEVELAVGELPKTEVAHALLAAGPDEQIGLRRIAHREIR